MSEHRLDACVVCGDATEFCCSDCAIDFGGKTYICEKRDCRKEHADADAPRINAHNAEARRLRNARAHCRIPTEGCQGGTLCACQCDTCFFGWAGRHRTDAERAELVKGPAWLREPKTED